MRDLLALQMISVENLSVFGFLRTPPGGPCFMVEDCMMYVALRTNISLFYCGRR